LTSITANVMGHAFSYRISVPRDWQLFHTCSCQRLCGTRRRVVPLTKSYPKALAATAALWLLPASTQAVESQGNQTASSYSSASEAPHLLYLALRCSDRPVDLQPSFSPTHYVYSAELDYADGSFAIDAQPAKEMLIINSGEFATTQLISPGSDLAVKVQVQNPSTQEKMDYSISITRLDGTSVHLRGLSVPGSSLEPAFSADTLEYTVLLPSSLDSLDLQLLPYDSGQTFEVLALQADFQEPTWTSTSALPIWTPSPAPASSSTSDGGASTIEPSTQVVAADAAISGQSLARRLAASAPSPSPPGESQRYTVERWFPVEVGGSRLITVQSRAANGQPSLTATYKFRASREPCPRNRPYFAPDIGRCAMTCNERFFARSNASRCENCPAHCMRCLDWDRCQACEPSQWRVLHFVQNVQGVCAVLHIPWGPLLAGTGLALALLVVCWCILNTCCYGKSRGPRRTWRKDLRRSDDADDGADGEQSQRLLDAEGKPSFPGAE